MVVASPPFRTVKVRPVGGRSAAAPSALHAAHGGGDGRFVGRADTLGHAVPRAGSARHRGCACAGCGRARRGRGGGSPEGHHRHPLPAARFLGTHTSRLLGKPQASTRPVVACIHTIGWMPCQMRTPLGRRRVLRIGLAVSLWFCTPLFPLGQRVWGEVREGRAKKNTKTKIRTTSQHRRRVDARNVARREAPSVSARRCVVRRRRPLPPRPLQARPRALATLPHRAAARGVASAVGGPAARDFWRPPPPPHWRAAAQARFGCPPPLARRWPLIGRLGWALCRRRSPATGGATVACWREGGPPVASSAVGPCPPLSPTLPPPPPTTTRHSARGCLPGSEICQRAPARHPLLSRAPPPLSCGRRACWPACWYLFFSAG